MVSCVPLRLLRDNGMQERVMRVLSTLLFVLRDLGTVVSLRQLGS